MRSSFNLGPDRVPVGDIAEEVETRHESQVLPGVTKGTLVTVPVVSLARLIGNDHQHPTSPTASMIKKSAVLRTVGFSQRGPYGLAFPGCLAGARRSVGGALLRRVVDLFRGEENDRLGIDRSGRGDRQVQ
jgi:hypothetical protein